MEERRREPHGVSIVLAGPSGIGKTHQIGNVADPSRTLVIDIDRGALPLLNVPVDIVRPEGWPGIVDLFAAIGGPNLSLPATSTYSAAHYERVKGLIDVGRYDTFVIDLLSQAGRESYRYAEAYPEAPSRGAGRDTRANYGQHARQMTAGLQQVQRGAPNKVIVLTAVMERVVDNLGRTEWRIQLEGEKTSRELPSIVDEIVAMHWIDFGDGKPTRAFVCTSPNPWLLPGKDRSGKLAQVEEPHLGKLLAKLTTPKVSEANPEV
jgi:hypothetical protein